VTKEQGEFSIEAKMRQKTGSENSINEPYKLPEGWRWVKLGDVCEKPQYGYTASAEERAVGPKFLRITDIQDGEVNWDSLPYCRCNYAEIEKYLLKSGDILFARTGGTTGKSYLITKMPTNTIFASYLIRVKTGNDLMPEYLYLFLQSALYWKQVEMNKRGGAQPNMNATLLSNIVLPLSSLPEQRRIAAKIQEFLQEVERAQTACKKQLEAAKLLPSAYLREVFESEEAKKWMRKRLGEVCEFGSGKFIQKEKVKNKGAYPVYGANGIIGFTEEKLFDKEMIVIGRVGSCGVVNKTLGPAWITDNTIILQHVNQTTFDFLYWVLKSLKLEETKAASVQPLITQKDLKSILIPLPPIDLQRRIAADLTEKMAYVEKLCTAIENQLEAINALPQVILRKAFRGEL